MDRIFVGVLWCKCLNLRWDDECLFLPISSCLFVRVCVSEWREIGDTLSAGTGKSEAILT